MTLKTTTAQPVTSYAAAYAALAEIATRLKGAGTAASIDTFAQDVVLARQMFEVARSRLDAIRAEIDAEITTDGANAGA